MEVQSPHGGPASRAAGDIFTVTTATEGVAGSLRAVMAQTTGGEIIRFDPSLAGTKIVLDTTIDVPNAVTIEGPADKGIVISGGNRFPMFHIHHEKGATFRNVTLTEGKENFADNDFVAAAVYGQGRLVLDHATVTGNSILQAAITSDNTVLINSTVASNPGPRGAVGILSVGRVIELHNSTVAFNPGGGMRGTTIITFDNSIVANNGPNGTENCGTTGPGFTYVGRSISNETSCGHGVLEMLITDPKLLPLADNGGPTQTLALASDSPAINATDCSSLTVDQRYVPRDAHCDIGAFEFQFTKVVLTLNTNGTVDPKTGAATITGTMTCSRAESFDLAVDVKQDQRVRRVPTTVVGSATVHVGCDTTPKPWIVLVAPSGAGFENIAASVNVQTANTNIGVTPSATSGDVQLSWAARR